MDWIQFPFEVNARVHRGAGAPVVRLRWVYTDQPFLPLGTHCAIMNRIWDEDQVTDLEVGQLQPELANYAQDERWTLGEGALGGHICHPEWLTTGEPWPTTLPDTVYTAAGLPVCCCVPTYRVISNEVATAVMDPLNPCVRWGGGGPVSGKLWVVVIPQPPGQPLWRVLRVRNGLPTFYVWRLFGAWDGRGASPPFVLDPPVQPGAPVPTVRVEEVTP